MKDIRSHTDVGVSRSILRVAILVLASSPLPAQAPTSNISNPAYQELANQVTANAANFYVYQDQDSGFNHGFPSGFFGSGPSVTIDTGCIDDPDNMITGCYPQKDSTNVTALDPQGTVFRISFPAESDDQYTGLNIEEPEDWGSPRVTEAAEWATTYGLSPISSLRFVRLRA